MSGGGGGYSVCGGGGSTTEFSFVRLQAELTQPQSVSLENWWLVRKMNARHHIRGH